jgi:hypothetical protein
MSGRILMELRRNTKQQLLKTPKTLTHWEIMLLFFMGYMLFAIS